MRRSRRVRHVIILTALLALLTCAACEPKFAMAPTPDPVTIRFGYREHTVQLETLFQAFHERYPWVTIEPVQANRWGSDMDNYIKAGAVDVFRDSSTSLRYAREGMIRSFDDIQLSDWAEIRDDYYRGAWEGLSISGQQWGIPAGLDVLVAYVNMDQATALKVDVPDANWSRFEFLDLANELNYPQGLPHASSVSLFGFCTTPQSIDPIVFIYSHGGRIVDDLSSPKEVTFDDPRTVEAVQWYSDLYNVHQIAPHPQVIKQNFRRGGIYEAAMRGRCGVWFGWYSGRGGIDIGREWSTEWTMLPLPRGASPFGLGESEGYYVTKDCENPKVALKLIRFLSDSWEAAGTRLPPRKSLVESEPYIEAAGEEILEVVAARSDRLIIINTQNSPELEMTAGILLTAITEIVTEDYGAANVLYEAQDKARPIFKTIE